MHRIWSAILLASLIACGARARPRPCPTPAAAAPALPPEDDTLRRWRAIHAAGDEPPAGTTAAELLPELLDYLGSPDPARRDGIGYQVLASWIVLAPRLSDDEVRALVAPLTAALDGRLDLPDGVYRRSFSALALSLIAKRDLDAPLLDDAARRGLLAAAARYAARETDLRGHDDVHGWIHAAAHTADLLKFLARQPGFDDGDRAAVLDAVASLVVRRHGFILHHGEDGRLAVPVVEALRRGVAAARIDAWLAAIAAPLGEPEPVEHDPLLYAAQRNARNLLFTLFVQLSLLPEPTGSVPYALDQLKILLAG